jgi:hypothetical protein
MRKIALVIATVGAAAMATPMFGTTNVMAQRLGVEVGPGGVHVGPRDRHCRTVTIREWRHGVKVTRTERRCDGGWRD